MTSISPSRALLSLRLAHLNIHIHGRANCQSLLCLKSEAVPDLGLWRPLGNTIIEKT